MDASTLKLLYGTDEPPAECRPFRAGPLDVEFEAGNLRHLRFGDAEVLRGIAFLVHDTGWGTYRPTITDLDVREEPGRFEIRHRALCSGPEGSFAYRARIEGRASGALLFACQGGAESDFATNRPGFVVFHPIEGSGGLADAGRAHRQVPRNRHLAGRRRPEPTRVQRPRARPRGRAQDVGARPDGG